jgi:hypothetical protein
MFIITLLTFFGTLGLVGFSRLKRMPQPLRALIGGVLGGLIATVIRSGLVILGVDLALSPLIVINVIAGAIASIFGASETIATKLKDDEEDSYVKPKDNRWFN